jgi:hypothetical protein
MTNFKASCTNLAGNLVKTLICSVLLTAPMAASAAIVVSANYSNTTYASGFSSLSTPQNGLFADMTSSTNAPPAQYGVNFFTNSSNESFAFLQNLYCVGTCSTYSLTTVTLTLTNTGSAAETMRFDSEITPGHLASIGNNPDAQGLFNFDVTETTGGSTRTLYSADGLASYSANGLVTGPTASITTSDGNAFNGLTESTDGATYDALDWSATNLNLLLDTILPGQTSTLTYTSLVSTTTPNSQCTDIADCAGVQVVFGDPRNTGGGTTGSASSAVASALAMSIELTPVINGNFGFAVVPFSIVSADSPLPPEPPLSPPVYYGPLFIPSSTPEPASWMLLIAGFGMVGAALRHGRPWKSLRTGRRVLPA